VGSTPCPLLGRLLRRHLPRRCAALRHCTRRFGGVTGDVFGAMAETAAAAAALVVPSLD
jgi:hypothetical protein